MDGKNVLSLVAILTIGFGAGLFVGSGLRSRSASAQIAAAVQKATDECEARHRTEPATTETPAAPAPAASTVAAPAPATPAPAGGVSGGSGKDMINRLLLQKGQTTPEPTAPPPPPPAPPAPEPMKKATARVFDARITSGSGGGVITGTVKNDTEVPCVSAYVTVVATDRRGIKTGEKSGPTSPVDVPPFGSVPFRMDVSFEGTAVNGIVVCN